VPRPRLHLLVCTNERPADAPRPCCAGRGGLEVYRALKDRVRELGLRDDVLVTRTGCLRHCSRGVTVCVWPGNHWHGAVEPGDAAELLAAALRGEPLTTRPMPDGPWE
jgi:(2Fe-2S) ferredoxin